MLTPNYQQENIVASMSTYFNFTQDPKKEYIVVFLYINNYTSELANDQQKVSLMKSNKQKIKNIYNIQLLTIIM